MKKQSFEKLIKTGTTRDKALYLHRERQKGTIKDKEREIIEASIPQEERETFDRLVVYSFIYADFFPTFSVVYFSAVCSHFALRNLLQIVHDEDRIIKDLNNFANNITEEFTDKETQQKILKLLLKNLNFETISAEVTESNFIQHKYNNIREEFKEQIKKATDDLIGLKSCILALQFYADKTDSVDLFLETYGKHIKRIVEDWAEEFYDGEFSKKKLDNFVKTKKKLTPEIVDKGVIPYFMGVEENEDFIKTFLQAIMRQQDRYSK
jgi:hypothetical protein